MSVFNYCDNSPEEILDTLSQTIAANTSCHGEVIVVLSGEHTNIIEAAGWTKARVKEYLASKVNELRPLLALDEARTDALGGIWSPGGTDPTESAVPTTPDSIDLLVAGGPGGGVAAVLPLFVNGLLSKTVIKPISGP